MPLSSFLPKLVTLQKKKKKSTFFPYNPLRGGVSSRDKTIDLLNNIRLFLRTRWNCKSWTITGKGKDPGKGSIKKRFPLKRGYKEIWRSLESIVTPWYLGFRTCQTGTGHILTTKRFINLRLLVTPRDELPGYSWQVVRLTSTEPQGMFLAGLCGTASLASPASSEQAWSAETLFSPQKAMSTGIDEF